MYRPYIINHLLDAGINVNARNIVRSFDSFNIKPRSAISSHVLEHRWAKLNLKLRHIDVRFIVILILLIISPGGYLYSYVLVFEKIIQIS